MTTRMTRKLLLVGWDGADWQLAKPLMEAGKMPALEYLVGRGVMGNLASMDPMLSPMLWTTIATGQPPRIHGVCGFLEPDPNSSTGVRLISSRSRRCRAFWEIFSQRGIRTDVVGWYGSHPAEPINGIFVSDQYTKPVGLDPQAWPRQFEGVYPPTISDSLAELRVHPTEITLPQLEYLVPQARQIDQTSDTSLQKLAISIAETASRQAMATWIMETQPWEVLAVYFDGIDHLGHDFMQYHPPKMPQVSQPDFDLYHQVMGQLYCFHDLMLNRLLKLVDDDTTVLLVSDHGYESGHRRPTSTPAQGAGPILWHRPTGVLAGMGPSLRKDELVFGARILDVTPTLLHLMGLPVGADMVGQVMTQIYQDPVEVKFLPSWESTEASSNEISDPSEQMMSDPFAEQLAMQQLVELGYIEPLPDDKRAAIDHVIAEQNFNLARSLMAGRRWSEAVDYLEAVHRQFPTRLMVALHLADCYQRLGRHQDCRDMVDQIAAGNCYETRLEDPNQRIRPQLDLLYGLVAMNEGQPEIAMECLERAEMMAGQIHGFGARLGEVYIQLQRWEDARRVLKAALRSDPEDVAAWNSLTVIHLQLEEDDAAVDAALQSLAILFHQPQPHFWLGLALSRLGQWDRAREAVLVTLKLQPDHSGAQRQLARIEEAIRQS